MNSHGDGKPEPVDPDQLLRMLDLELMQKRARRKQAGARRNSLRAISFFFLFVVILGALLAGYFAFSSGRVDGLRSRNNQPSSPTPALTRP